MRSCSSGWFGGFARDVEAGQDEDADVVFLHELPVLRRNALPGGFGRVAGFPDEAAALLDAFERVGVRERLRIAAQHHVHVIQLAVHLDPLGRDGEIIIGRRALLFRAVFRVGHDEQLFLERAVRVVASAFCSEMNSPKSPMIEPRFLPVVIMPQPPMEWNRTAMAPVGQQRRRVLADDGVGMIDAEDEDTFRRRRRRLPSLRRGLAGGEFVGAERVLGPEIARTDAVGAAEEARRFVGRERGQRAAELRRLRWLCRARRGCRAPADCRRPCLRRCVRE